jgi:predicted metal-dependent peptidase
MNEERKLSKAKVSLMRDPKFVMWAGVMMIGDTHIVDDLPTAATDGRNEYYGRKFVAAMNHKMLAFVVLHENLHKALRHLSTWVRLFKEDAQLANIACDYVINQMIVDMDPQGTHTELPSIGGKSIVLLDAKYKGLNSKQVFDMLKEDKKNGEGLFGPGDKSPDSMDEHRWEDAKNLTEAEKKELEQEIDQAIRQGQMQHQKMHGSGAGNLNRELGDLMDPQVDWKELLREFVTQMCAAKDMSSWRRVNRRFLSAGIYMPSLIGERVERITVGIDTSGSIGAHELNTFLSEVRAVVEGVRPGMLDLIYWDAAVAGHETYTESDMGSLVQSTKPKGGGGTDPACMDKYMSEHDIKPNAIIMLTDGYVPNWGHNWPSPILWVVANNPNAVAAHGKTIHIKD